VTELQTEYLRYATLSCDQIACHFNDLIDTARLDAGKLQLNPRQVDVTGAFDRAIGGVAERARQKKISIITEIREDAHTAFADEPRLVQIISNLVCNAVKFTPRGGRIDLSTNVDPESNDLLISVSDTGCGVKIEELSRIFERLYQVEHKADEPLDTGLGLGLSIAQELAKLHGGSIQASSEPGCGSTFVLRLPARPPGMESSSTRSEDHVDHSSRGRRQENLAGDDDSSEIGGVRRRDGPGRADRADDGAQTRSEPDSARH
jgi:signal transduction histidine kinase